MSVIALVAVKVKPFTVAACPAANALNTTVSFDLEPEPARNVDNGVADAKPEVVTTVGSADTASMAVPLMVKPETAAVEVEVTPAIVASEPIFRPMVKLLPPFKAVEVAAKPADTLRCALASVVMDTAWLPMPAAVPAVTLRAAVLELLTLEVLKLLASLSAVKASLTLLSMNLTAE